LGDREGNECGYGGCAAGRDEKAQRSDAAYLVTTGGKPLAAKSQIVGRNCRAYFAALTILFACAPVLRAQDRQAPDPAPPSPTAQEQERGLRKYMNHPPEMDQGGGLHFTKHWAVVFGGIKPGSAIALGPAVSTAFANGGYAQVKGVYSIRRFSLLQARYDTPAFWGRHAMLVSRVRWQDAPTLDLYELGPDSSRNRGRYSERKTELRSELALNLSRLVRASAGFGLERFAISAGAVEVGEDHPLASIPLEPGLADHPWFSHAFFSMAVDTKRSGYARAGRLIDGTVDDYRDWHLGVYAFQRAEVGAQQLVPIASRDSLEIAARVWDSAAAAGHDVPFFLMPTIGGGDYLEAFNVYRFRDRAAAWAKLEYRHAVHEMFDVVGFYELGTVAPSLRALSPGSAVPSVGVGVIAHSKTANFARVAVAHGRDGFHFTIMFIPGGA
jgi:hypothetical protein